MNDKDLANALVGHGIGNHTEHGYFPDMDIIGFMDAATFVRDARVAMACEKRSGKIFCEKLNDRIWAVRIDAQTKTRNWHEDESLERAICMAYVEAMT